MSINTECRRDNGRNRLQNVQLHNITGLVYVMFLAELPCFRCGRSGCAAAGQRPLPGRGCTAARPRDGATKPLILVEKWTAGGNSLNRPKSCYPLCLCFAQSAWEPVSCMCRRGSKKSLAVFVLQSGCSPARLCMMAPSNKPLQLSKHLFPWPLQNINSFLV